MLHFEFGSVHIGFSSLLVCMMLGTIFCNICDFSAELMDRLDRWTAPMFILFFVLSGAELEFSVFAELSVVGIGIVYILARSFGTPIDFYAQLNLDGFVNIVNAIGGVDVYIQEDMDYEDPLQNPPLKIHLKKGMQHLDGKKAEQFIRFRYGYAAADIARIDALQAELNK